MASLSGISADRVTFRGAYDETLLKKDRQHESRQQARFSAIPSERAGERSLNPSFHFSVVEVRTLRVSESAAVRQRESEASANQPTISRKERVPNQGVRNSKTTKNSSVRQHSGTHHYSEKHHRSKTPTRHEIPPPNMADTPQSPLKHEESATTREEVDFSDTEQGPPSPVSPIAPDSPTRTSLSPTPGSGAAGARKNVSFQDNVPVSGDAPPAKPPRPLSPQQQAENTLIEAFPSIDTKVVKAVLMASGGQVEPAFNALLAMSDPDFTPEPPRQPPRPTGLPQLTPQQQRAAEAPISQLEADEIYARQLAEQYNAAPAQHRYNQREPARRAPNAQPVPPGQRRRPSWASSEDGGDHERNFFDDELPEIGRNIQQGFFDTQKKVNSWIANFKKKIDGEGGGAEDEDLYSSGSRTNTGLGASSGRQRKDFGPSQSAQLAGIQRMGEQQQQQRRSMEANRFDADPHELGDEEFERLELRDDETEDMPPGLPPRTSSRPQGAASGGRAAPNPNLFKSSNARPPPQSGPVDEVEAAGEPQSGDAKAKKWRPLTTIAPQPADDENDPFSLGDEDEDLRKEDTARLKEAARASVGTGTEGTKKLEETQSSGSLNAEAAELLQGKTE